MKRERAVELLSRTIETYVQLADSVGNSKPLTNEQVCNDLKLGKKELKELGLNFDNRRK
jgi:hypothetical protein